MPTEFYGPEIARLKSYTSLDGIERIDHVSDINRILTRSLHTGIEPAVIPDAYGDSVKEMALLGLRAELQYIEGVSEQGQIDVLQQRISADWGLKGVVEVLAVIHGSTAQQPTEAGQV